MPHCEALCALLRGVAESLPHQGLSRQIWPAFGGNLEDERKSRIKARRRPRHLCRSHLPAVRAVSGISVGVGNGVKIRKKTKFCGRYPPTLTPTRKKQGSTLGRSQYEQKREIPPLPVAGEKGHSGVPVTGEWEPEHHRLLAGGRAGHGGLYPRRRWAESVRNVRKTNGCISLEQHVRGAWEEDDE